MVLFFDGGGRSVEGDVNMTCVIICWRIGNRRKCIRVGQSDYSVSSIIQNFIDD